MGADAQAASTVRRLCFIRDAHTRSGQRRRLAAGTLRGTRFSVTEDAAGLYNTRSVAELSEAYWAATGIDARAPGRVG